MANEFLVERVVTGNFTFPANAAGVTASTLSADAGVYIPKGAIITDIWYLPTGALTNASNLKDATINPAVGTQVLGTNNVKASVAIVQTVVGSQAPAGSGVLVAAGGNLAVNFASSDSARTGVAFDCNIYVKYLKP